MTISNSKITLSPILPCDFPIIARLEAAAFANEEFGAVAFGPHRFSDAAMASRAASLAIGPKPGETLRNVKAVTIGPEGEEIVGFAAWVFCVGRGGSEEEMRRLGTKEGWVENENEEDKDPFGPGANVRFCEDAILRGDEHMARSTEGRDYASK